MLVIGDREREREGGRGERGREGEREGGRKGGRERGGEGGGRQCSNVVHHEVAICKLDNNFLCAFMEVLTHLPPYVSVQEQKT